MAIAAIGKLPATIEDRSISINLKRRRLDEKIERVPIASRIFNGWRGALPDGRQTA